MSEVPLQSGFVFLELLHLLQLVLVHKRAQRLYLGYLAHKKTQPPTGATIFPQASP